MTQITTHFSEAEFTASGTAARRGINNSLPDALRAAALETCQMMERIRRYLSDRKGKEIAIIVTSGYRCLALNRAIGSSDTSDHVRALAMDFKAPGFGSPFEVCEALAPRVSDLAIGQLIHEFGAWVHVSTRMPDKRVNRIITIKNDGTHVGIVP